MALIDTERRILERLAQRGGATVTREIAGDGAALVGKLGNRLSASTSAAAAATTAELSAVGQAGQQEVAAAMARRAGAARVGGVLGITDRIAGTASTVLSLPMQIFEFAMMPLMLIGGMVQGIGRWFDGKDAVNPGRISTLGNAIGAPVRWVNEPFHKLGAKLGINDTVKSLAESTANTVSWPISGAVEKTGLGSLMQWKNNRQATGYWNKATKIAAGADKVGTDFIAKIPTELQELQKPFETLHQNIKAFGANPSQDASKAIQDSLANINQVKETILSGNDKTLQAALGKIPKPAAKLYASAENTVAAVTNATQHQNKAAGWKPENIKESIKDVPQAIGKAPIGHTVLNASMVGLSAVGMYGTARQLLPLVESLRQLCADIEGKPANKISTFRLFLGRVHPEVAKARGQLLKTLGVQGLLQTVGLIFGIKRLVGGEVGTKGFMVQMGLSLGAPLVVGLTGGDVKESVLPHYQAFHEAYKHGNLATEGYAAFIAMANKSFGGIGAQHPVTMDVAKKFAEDKTSLGEIMKLHASGELEKLGNAAFQKLRDKEKAAQVQAPEAETKTHSHVDALKEKEKAKAVVAPKPAQLPVEVVGTGIHTGALATKATNAEAHYGNAVK